MEGYGRSTKIATTTLRFHKAPTTATQRHSISRNCAASGRFWFTEFHPAHCARQCSPSDIRSWLARLALDAMVWTGEGSPTLEQRRKKLPEFQSKNRRPIDKAFIHSIFERDHPGTADGKGYQCFCRRRSPHSDTSVPTGTYVDMCSRLPVVNPEKITVPT
jgi:hypothetical protein